MADIEGANGDVLQVKRYRGSALVSAVPKAAGFMLSALTGSIATGAGGLAADSTIFAARFDPTTSLKAHIHRIHITMQISVGTLSAPPNRALAITRAATADSSGGTNLTTFSKKLTTDAGSEFDSANGGSTRIASTAALTTTGIAFESNPLLIIPTGCCYATGDVMQHTFDFTAVQNTPLVIQPGELLTLRTINLYEINSTFIFGIDLFWHEE